MMTLILEIYLICEDEQEPKHLLSNTFGLNGNRHFWTQWKQEYFTALRETHKVTGNNEQRVKIGDVVLVHDDTPRIRWKLAVIEGVNKEADGLI